MRTSLEIENFCAEQNIKNSVEHTIKNLELFVNVSGFDVSYDQIFEHVSPRHYIHFSFDGDDFRMYRERVYVGRYWFMRSYVSRNIIEKRGNNPWTYTVNGRIDYSLLQFFDEDMLCMKAFELDLK